MKKLFLGLMLCFTCTYSFSQENNIDVYLGYSFNTTNHWLVGWENKPSLGVEYSYNKKFIKFGAGINYSSFDIEWYRYYNSDKNTIKYINPFVSIGLNMDIKKWSFIPQISVGYSFIKTNIEIYEGDNSSLFVFPSLWLKYNINDKFSLGLKSGYNISMQKLDFNTQDWVIHHDFVPIEDKKSKYITAYFSIGYKIGK